MTNLDSLKEDFVNGRAKVTSLIMIDLQRNRNFSYRENIDGRINTRHVSLSEREYTELVSYVQTTTSNKVGGSA